MTRLRIIVLLLFVVAFGAGLSVGRLMTQPRPPAPPEPGGSSRLARELELSDAQREQMFGIWDEVNRSGFAEGRRRRELQRERVDAIASLIPAESQAKLEEINQKYGQQVAEMMAERQRRFDEAVTKTKAILDPHQQQKYEAFLARREQDRVERTGRPDRPGMGRRGEQGPPSPRRRAEPPAAQPGAVPGAVSGEPASSDDTGTSPASP